eukprot:6220121-Pyramimonas_sp.AAC.1
MRRPPTAYLCPPRMQGFPNRFDMLPHSVEWMAYGNAMHMPSIGSTLLPLIANRSPLKRAAAALQAAPQAKSKAKAKAKARAKATALAKKAIRGSTPLGAPPLLPRRLFGAGP